MSHSAVGRFLLNMAFEIWTRRELSAGPFVLRRLVWPLQAAMFDLC